MTRKIITDPKDAPPVTARTLREMANRIYDLEQTQASTTSQQLAGSKGLGATVQNLSGTVSDLNSRYAIVSNGDFSVDTGGIPADSTWRTYGNLMSVTIESPGPHKQTVVHVGAGGVTVDSRSASSTLASEITFKFASQPSYGSYVARLSTSRVNLITVSPYVQREFRLGAGLWTITAVMRGWNASGGDSSNKIIFRQPYLRAEVTGSSSSSNSDSM
jgi:hypothetical protein